MRVVIVAKTRMKGNVLCVGGFGLDGGETLRLLQANGSNQPHDCPFDIGEIWEIQGRQRNDCQLPHVEDFLVTGKHLVGRQPNLESFLLQRVRPWRGGAEALFDGAIRFTSNRAGYISKRVPPPACSTGFWLADRPLTLERQGAKIAYLYARDCLICRLPYVGTDPTQETISQGTLVRVSLARWWRPDDAPEMEERCYLQLSGWYDSARSFVQAPLGTPSRLGVAPEDDIPF
jgi:hypothetical protein